MQFDKIQAGMTLWDVHRHRVGNTNRTEWGVWPVYVREVRPAEREALVSWNGNKPEWRSEHHLAKMRAKKPERCDECRRLIGHAYDCSRKKRTSARPSSSASR